VGRDPAEVALVAVTKTVEPERIREALEGAVSLTVVEGTFEEAVAAGVAAAERGDVLLLSPACSSFDMFSGYEE